jgi:hypothetical protein
MSVERRCGRSTGRSGGGVGSRVTAARIDKVSKEACVGEHSAQWSVIFNCQTAVTLALGLKKRLTRYADDWTMERHSKSCTCIDSSCGDLVAN